MTRAEAIARLRQHLGPVPRDQVYAVGDFAPEDGEGVAALFYTAYGDAYPLDMYYIPDAIRQACREGRLHPVVARLEGGQVVGFSALYASSPPFPGLIEYGLGIVHPAYRGTFVLFHMSKAIMEKLDGLPGVEAVFGEAVCDTVITQHSSALFGFTETAIELDLLPEKQAGQGRTACLVMFRNGTDRRRRLYHPVEYAEAIGWIVSRAGLDRELVALDAATPLADATRLRTEVFAQAAVMRVHVFAIGPDGPEALEKAAAQGRAAGCLCLQYFLNTAEPSAMAIVPYLRQAGYGLGGLIPRWFDDDALLMQQFLGPTAPDTIQLFSDDARTLLAHGPGRPARDRVASAKSRMPVPKDVLIVPPSAPCPTLAAGLKGRPGTVTTGGTTRTPDREHPDDKNVAGCSLRYENAAGGSSATGSPPPASTRQRRGGTGETSLLQGGSCEGKSLSGETGRMRLAILARTLLFQACPVCRTGGPPAATGEPPVKAAVWGNATVRRVRSRSGAFRERCDWGEKQRVAAGMSRRGRTSNGDPQVKECHAGRVPGKDRPVALRNGPGPCPNTTTSPWPSTGCLTPCSRTCP